MGKGMARLSDESGALPTRAKTSTSPGPSSAKTEKTSPRSTTPECEPPATESPSPDRPAEVACSGCSVAIEPIRVGPRWISPGICLECRDIELAAERAEQTQRYRETVLRGSKVPNRLQGYRLSRTARPQPGEKPDAFRARIAALPEKTIGLVKGNVGAHRQLLEWTPGDRSLYIFGPVGTGKSTLSAAFAAGAILHGWSSAFISEAGLYQAIRDETRHQERGVRGIVASLKEADLIVIDDLGTSTDPKDWMVDIVEQVICNAYDDERTLVITSNKALDELGKTYGVRVSTRLYEMTAGQQIQLAGMDWRTGRRAS